MSKFITRVQLRNAEQGDYERLDIDTAAGRIGRQYSLTVMKEKRVVPA